jgi:Flp pilus assembly protein protease CpaA
MSFEQHFLHLALLALLLLAAIQDAREREVSNLITIPLFLVGVLGVVLSGNLATIVVAVAIVVAASMNGGYGAADAKILVGLAGLWPQTILPCLVAMTIFDLFWRKYQQNDSPLVVAIWIGVLFMIVWNIW